MKKMPIINLSSAIKTTGLGLFLVVGFNGCQNDKCNKENLKYAPQSIKDECRNQGSTSGHSVMAPMYSGFFSSSGSSSMYNSGGG